jgi:phosphonoacetate hydrolase
MRLARGQRCIILMLDGFGLDYYRAAPMPALKTMADEGLFCEGSAVFPTLTNANNLSIVCGSFPETHGVTTNCYLDPTTSRPAFLEDPGFLKSPTLFDVAARHGIRSALVTSKSKTVRILGPSVAVGVAVQDPDAATVARFGPPPDIYSVEANEYILRAGLRLLEEEPDLGILYVHTTDYPMHMWGPDAPESLDHLARLDRLIGELAERNPDAAFLVTADHGMNPKSVCLDLEQILRAAGFPIRAAISPVADRLVKHHGGHGGVSYVYLSDRTAREGVLGFLARHPGVDRALPAETAAAVYRLDPDRIGDIVVGADRETVFGSVERERVPLAPGYRNHGSRFEAEIPLIAWNAPLRRDDGLRYNLDLTRILFFGDAV